MIEQFGRQGGYDCETVRKLRGIAIPNPDLSTADDFLQAFIDLATILWEEFLACICSAALPPCRGPGDPRVPLAVVSVRKRDCSVVSVCNWTPERKHVLTFPNLLYWFGWLPYTGLIRQFMTAICCGLLGLVEELTGSPAAHAAHAPSHDVAPPAAAEGQTLEGAHPAPRPDLLGKTVWLKAGNYAPTSPAGNIALALVGNLQSDPSTLTLRDVLGSMFDPVRLGSGSEATQPAEVERLARSPALKMMTEALRPLTQSIPPGIFGGPAAGRRFFAEVRAAEQPVGAAAADIEELRGRLTALQQTVVEQQSQIDALRNTTPPGGPR
jgi:hypothetical protein